MQVPDIATPRRVVFGSPVRSSGRDYSFESLEYAKRALRN